MKVSGEATLHASVDKVYATLHDPAVLVRTIPGCERLEQVGPDAYRMAVTAGVAAIKGTYAGEVLLTDVEAPHAFLLKAAGSGAPGTVSAVVTVRLADGGDCSTVLTYDAVAKTLTVEIKLVGLAPSSSHPAHIHAGSCAHQGAVDYPLNAVMADATGVADSKTTVSSIKEGGIPDSTWYVNVHNGPGLSPDVQFQPLVCGDVANASKATSVTVQMLEGPTPPPGSVDETAMGTATLTIVNGALQVVITASGLAPSGSHAAHIHMGSCESQGAVVHPLSSVVADATGKGTSTTTVPSVTSIPSGTWYVNVHRSTLLTTQTDFDPIICGDVVPGS